MDHFSVQAQKTKKIYPEKKFLIFPEMELSNSNTKRIISFFQKKLFLYFLKRNFFLYFRTWNPVIFTPSSKNNVNPPRGNLLYFRKQKPPKNSLYFVKIVFFVSTDFIPNSIIFF